MLSLNRLSQQPWVVLVEDDESLRGELASALERALPEVEVQRTPDADVALDLVRDERSCLLITEAQTSSVDGLALAACARRQRPQLPLIFLADTRMVAASARAADLRGSHLVDKPPRLDQFVDLVARVLEPPPGFRGELATSGVLELVQLVTMTVPTGALCLSGPAGYGKLWFENGSVVHAVAGHERGTGAFQRILRWRNGQFSIEAAARAPERSVTGNTMALLLDAARRFDEEIEAGAGEREVGASAAPCEPHAGAAVDAVEHAETARANELPVGESERDAALLPRPPEQDSDPYRLTRQSHVAIRAVRAREATGDALGSHNRQAAVHFESGLQAAWRKDYVEALSEWERAAVLEPENRLYQHNLMRLRHLIDMDREQKLGR